MPATRLAARVVARLAQAEACELNPHYGDDLRIARLTVAYAASGLAVLCSPHVLASYMVLGLHPNKVWPAILARRKALGGLEVSGARPVPKKPAQSVQLWFEKTNAARAGNSRGAMLQGSPRTTISVPMAAPSIAALYRNPDEASSAKTRPFTLDELKRFVGYSGAPHSICKLTISALRARGEWPNQDGPATTVLSVAILGIMFEGVCCRRTVQRRIKRAVQLGYWRRVRDANSWTDCPKCGAKRSAAKCAAANCDYRGRSKDEKGDWTGEFMRVPAYEFDVEKFRIAPRCRELEQHEARSYPEYKTGARQNVREMPRKGPRPAPDPKTPGPAAPLPVREKPAAKVERKPLEITRDVRMSIAGCYSTARKQGKDEAGAIRETCEALSSETRYLAESEVRLQLKIWQSKHGSLEPPKPSVLDRPLDCQKCGSALIQNRGPGPRLKCPQCDLERTQ